MNKKQYTLLIIIITVIMLAAATAGYFYYGKVNFLIPGVPYQGIYTLFFSHAGSSQIASILEIIGYWGDTRFNTLDLKEKFQLYRNNPAVFESGSTLKSPIQIKSETESFFTENGYETSGWLTVRSDSIIRETKKFVNSKERKPVIALTKRIIDEKTGAAFFSMQVVIGVFDNSRKVIVHDVYYGNNYEISYDNFEKLFQSEDGSILAVWPSDEINESIEGPNYDIAYRPRLENMDEIGTLWITKYLPALRLWQTDNYTQMFTVWQEFFNDPIFDYLPPAVQVVILSNYARIYVGLDQPDNAIKIINEQVLPLNQNLSQASEGWRVPPLDSLADPYFILSSVYLKKGERNLAINAYKEMVKIRGPAIRNEMDIDNYITATYLIEELEEELEKEISGQN